MSEQVFDIISDWYGSDVYSYSHTDPNVERCCNEWGARKVIYLEGPYDYKVLAQNWFSSSDSVEFKIHPEDRGGCTWVEASLEDDPHAFGIVDRDTLLCSNLEHYLESDDNHFLDKNITANPKLLILTHHELEGLLFNVENVLTVLDNRNKISQREDGIAKLYDVTKLVMKIDSAAFALRILDKRALFKNNGYGSRQEMNVVHQDIAAKLAEINDDAVHKYEEIEGVLSERMDAEDDMTSGIESVVRFLDGKRLLRLFELQFGLQDAFDRELAVMIKKQHEIPDYLFDFISSTN